VVLVATVVWKTEMAPQLSMHDETKTRFRFPFPFSWLQKRTTRRSFISVLVFMAAWELTGRFVLTDPLFFAPLSAVVEAGFTLWHSGELQRDIIASFSAVAYGMILAIIFGIIIGVLSGASGTFREYTDSFFTGLYATPLVAVAPILILWFGIGIASKIAVVFLMAIFPILISTAAGIANADPAFIEVARSFGASRLQIIRKVMIPAAVPFVITGIRLAIGRAIVGVVVGELFGARAGLGFLIFTSGQTFDVPALFLGVLLLALAGVALTSAMKWVEGRVAGWRHMDLEN
jgi:NitT/TauT family transport system permease protein